MGRPGRFRSGSGGSTSELLISTANIQSPSAQPPKAHQKRSSEASTTASQTLMQIILQLRDDRGHGLLHKIANDTSFLKVAQFLLHRAASVTLLEQFLTQADFESGYTPLHWAILHGSLPALLLLLRFPNERLVQRPMHLLLASANTNRSSDHHTIATIMTMKDGEGFTPFQLLSELQVKTLAEIRLSLPKPNVVESSSSTATETGTRQPSRRRASSFSLDEVEETDDPRHSSNPDLDTCDSCISKHGCEVMTFGATHHPALGVSDTTKHAHQTNCPQRILEFALSQRRSEQNNTAVQVAAAAHHSLILTRQGHVYACGLGKGGRLGTSDKEQSTPVPLRVKGPLLKRHVTFVAAAENHSICVTKDGIVFSWGSNRFGQLDASSSSNYAICPFPTRVADMKKPCIAVAAGDRHSVALTRFGEVYTWGDNTAGQLGRNRKSGVERVEALWNRGERVAIQVEASEKSTLVLVGPSGRNSRVNSVYTWGHGNRVPIKVTFDVGTVNQTGLCNPVDIACARHHNAAVTKDGRVFTFGLHAETLASKQSSSLVVASPVTGMYPENGGGFAVAVSASDQRTAVVTSQGHLFTWGSTADKDVMGHQGIRWQPSPKRVEGVHRAVSVAVAKEHTVLLLGTSFPELPRIVNDSSLENLAARRVCDHIDMFNVIPIAIMAERTQTSLLQNYCCQFIKENLDGVLTFGRKSELDVYLNEQLAESRATRDRDVAIHPLVMEAVMVEKSQSDWLGCCVETLHNLPVSTLVRYQHRTRRRAVSIHDHRQPEKSAEHLQTGHQGCSDKCLMLTSNLTSLGTEEEILEKHDSLSREIRSLKKRLTQAEKLLVKECLSSDEREKLNRKPLMEADLAQLIPALERVERLMAQRNVEAMTVITDDAQVKKEASKLEMVSGFHCDVCDVACPDANHLELHKSGRKHRNRLRQVEEEANDQTAKSISEGKRQQAIIVENVTSPVARTHRDNAWSTASSVQPRYQLPSPSVPPGPIVFDKAGPVWSTNATTEKATSLRSILAEETERKIGTTKLQKSCKPPAPTPSALASPRDEGPLPKSPWSSSPVVNPSPVVFTPVKRSSWAPPPVAKTPPVPPKLSSERPPMSVKKGSTSCKKQSLNDFLQGPAPVKTALTVVAPWAHAAAPKKDSLLTLPSTSAQAMSLLQIQRQEEEFAQRQSKHVAKEAKWYIGPVDRAGSFSSIQELDARERNMRLLIEEQHEIERQIKDQIELEKTKLEQLEKKKKSVRKNEKQKGTGNATSQPNRLQGKDAKASATGKSRKNASDSSNRKQKQPQAKPRGIAFDEGTARPEQDIIITL
ncbi:hypothetical protein MHU86_16657 [Fragilaria crotonensis]|nr:hypothetical protein MHU86_16657 [Fragilaria crotonensis]